MVYVQTPLAAGLVLVLIFTIPEFIIPENRRHQASMHLIRLYQQLSEAALRPGSRTINSDEITATLVMED